MIAVEDLHVSYGDQTVLKNVNAVLEPGLHVVLGRNGSGKTTLLKAVAGLVKPSKGRVLVMGRDVHRLSRREAVRLVGYAWQNPYLGFVEASVRDELEFSSRVAGVELNSEIIEMLVPRHLMNRNPFTLSGGEAKRVSMACVLALDQPVWLLDEPFDYMDSDGVEAVVNVVRYGLRRQKTIVIASAHTAYLHALRPSRVLVISSGEIAFAGPSEGLDEETLRRLGVPTKAVMCGPGL